MDCHGPSLLSAFDPRPEELVGGTGPLVLVCEHAGRAVPSSLAANMPPPEDMDRHIAYDVGAAEVARGLAARLGAALALQRYSRLVIDCNRQRRADDLAPAVADGSIIAFNQGLREAELEARWQAIHQPFHEALSTMIDAIRPAGLIAVHSFTPSMQGGEPRPMEVGLLVHRSMDLAQRLRAETLARAPELRIDFNAPYVVDSEVDYTIPTHASGRGLPHVLIEIRNDLIADERGVARWVDLLAGAIGATVPASGP